MSDRGGATAVEYGLILALIVLSLFGALVALGGRTSSLWGNVNNAVANAH